MVRGGQNGVKLDLIVRSGCDKFSGGGVSRHDSKASLSPLDSLLLARRVRKFIRLACARIDDRQFVLVLRMSLDPRGREAYLLAFRLMHAGLRVLDGRESVILDVLSPVRLHFAFHQIVPIHVFPRVAQFRSGRHFDIICLSGNQRVASYKDRECDRHQEWTDCCGPVPLHHAVPHSGSRRIVSFNEKPVEVPATGSALAKQRGVGLAFPHARR